MLRSNYQLNKFPDHFRPAAFITRSELHRLEIAHRHARPTHASVCSAGTGGSNFACQPHQRRSDGAGTPQHPEAIEEAKKRSLLLNHARQLRLGMQRCIRRREAMRGEVSRQSTKCFLVALLERGRMSNEHGLVVLRSPREKRCHSGDADPCGPRKTSTRSMS